MHRCSGDAALEAPLAARFRVSRTRRGRERSPWVKLGRHILRVGNLRIRSNAGVGTGFRPPPNSKLKPTLKRLGRTPASRRHAGCRSRVAVQRYARQPACRCSRSRAAPAAQLSLKPVRRTKQGTLRDAEARTHRCSLLGMPTVSIRHKLNTHDHAE
jgi:hypothetical protein